MSDQFLLSNYTRYPLTLESGQGCHVFDPEGNRYLDMIAGIGVNAFGYAHPRLTAVLQQPGRALHTHLQPGLQPPPAALAERLCRLAALDRAFFSNSGTEAVETALKAVRARSTPAKDRIVSLHRSFHGRTMASLSVTGQPDLRRNFIYPGANITFVEPNDADALRAAIAGDTAALILEPVLGEGGIVPLDIAYLQLARELTSRAGALLIADEVQCGLGRTGKPFAYQWAGIQPDIVCAAKPLAAGLPLGATLFTEDAAQWLPPHSHGSTFGGGPLACRVALEFLDLMEEQLPHIAALSPGISGPPWNGCPRTPSRDPRDPRQGPDVRHSTRSPRLPHCGSRAARGLLVNATQDTVLRLLPPYIAGDPEVLETVRILDEALRSTCR